MAVSLSGMTLYSDCDSGTGWDATSDGVDTYNESIQGVNSQSWQIRKNENLTSFLSVAASMPTGRGVFIVWLKSDVQKFYNNVDIVLRSSTNNEKSFAIATAAAQNVDGLWRSFVLDYVNKGTETGNYNPANQADMGWHLAMQNTNFRAITNNWCDASYYGPGHTISGTTTGDLLFSEAAAIDQTTANQYGVLQNFNDIIYAQADITLSGTNLVSSGETLVFKDTPNGYSVYNFDVTGTVVMTNTVVIAAGSISYDFDTSSATSYTQTGGSHTGYNTFVTGAGQTMSGLVLQSGGTATIANTISASSFNQCGVATLTGQLNGCNFNAPNILANEAAVVTADLAKLSDCDFADRGTNGHAVELTANTGTFTWANDFNSVDYPTGSTSPNASTPITPTSNGNETIYCTATTGTITIEVSSGYPIPSIRSAGVSVIVLSGGVTIDITVKDVDGNLINGAYVWINDGSSTIFNGQTSSGVIPQQSYSGGLDSTCRVRLFGYKPVETTLATGSGNVNQTIQIVADSQQVAVPSLVSSWNINTTTSKIINNSGSGLPHADYSTIEQMQDLYEHVMNTFANSSFMEFAHPLESATARDYSFVNGWTFGNKDSDYKYIYGGSVYDTANNLQWSNVKSIGSVTSGSQLYVVQGTTALTSWWPQNNIDILVKVRDGAWITTIDDNQTAIDGGVWCYVREYGDLYDHFFTNLSPGGQSVIALTSAEDLNNATASGTVGTYTDISVSFGAFSRSLDGVNFYNYSAEVDCNGRPLSEVYEYLKYITSFDFSQTINGQPGYDYRNADEATFSNVDFKQAPFGTYAGGRLFGAHGVFFVNMAGADNTNYELIDNTGTKRFPPLTVTFAFTGLKDGTEVRMHRDSDGTELAGSGVEDMTGGVGTDAGSNVTVTGTTNDNTYSYTYTYDTSIPFYAVILNNGYQYIKLSGLTITNSNQTIPITQIIDRNYFNP